MARCWGVLLGNRQGGRGMLHWQGCGCMLHCWGVLLGKIGNFGSLGRIATEAKPLVVLGGLGWGVLIGSAIGSTSAAAASGGVAKFAGEYSSAGSRSSFSESSLRRF